ncbi:MAG: hypothetical protein ACO1NX_01005 [Chitinophagaceae bacterium]
MAEEKIMEEADLMKQLSGPAMDKQTLRYYSDFITKVQRQNLKLERIWWDGQPVPDILVAQTRMPIKDIARLTKLFEVRVGKLDIFPLGIPVPDELLVQIKTPRFNPNVARGDNF